MNRFTAPTSIPAFLSDFKKEENKQYSVAKLNIFYIGQTQDCRLFTKDFSDQVLTTLPSTPVVAFYSSDKDDFIGHNKTQYSYGHVPENAEISYVKDDDGVTWAQTDVILYTERDDNIGEVANKIVGKQHSLELNPSTLKYKVNRDKQGNLINVEFTYGQFVGLSVLGDDEKPAFNGSGFFTENEGLADELKNKFNAFVNLLNNDGGKIEVDSSKNFFTVAAENFAKITMQEYISNIYSALEGMNVYGYVVENTEDYAVISQWSEELEKCVYYKYSLSTAEDGAVTLSNPVVVKAKYLTAEEENALTTNVATATDTATDTANAAATATSTAEDNSTATENANANAAVTEDAASCSSAAQTEDKPKTNCAENTDKNEEGESESGEKQKENDQTDDKVGQATANSSATTLSDSERAELENYRKQEKLRLISDYEQDIDHSILEKYSSTVTEFSYQELEAALAIEYRKAAKAKLNETTIKPVGTFSKITTVGEYNENDPADVIKKYK